jgi:basic amino acid/polyamine antiporter, APA family
LVGWWGGFLAVLVTVPFWFVGFDTIPQAAEEASSSVKPRQLAFLIVSSIVAATLFYVLIVAAVALVGPWRDIVDTNLPAATAFTAAFGSPTLARLVLVAALLGLFTSWNGFFLAGSRVLFALGRGRIISPWFGETHPRYGTPHRAVLVTGGMTLLAPLMGRDALLPFVNAGSFLIAIAFLGVALSFRRLRQSAPDLARPFKMSGGSTFPVLAALGATFLLLAMIIPGSPAVLAWPHEIIILGGVALLAVIFWFRATRMRAAVPAAQRDYYILEDYAPACRQKAASTKSNTNLS